MTDQIRADRLVPRMVSPIDTARIAHRTSINTRAVTYTPDAHHWAAGCRDELRRNAQQLATAGRAVLGTTDLAQADAFARAARRILGNVQGTRRFFGVILTPPNDTRKDSEHGL